MAISDNYREIVDNLVKEQAIPPSVSPGKHLPVKGLAYALLDDQYPPDQKILALHNETLRRYLKLLLVPKLGDEKVSKQLADQQKITR